MVAVKAAVERCKKKKKKPARVIVVDLCTGPKKVHKGPYMYT